MKYFIFLATLSTAMHAAEQKSYKERYGMITVEVYTENHETPEPIMYKYEIGHYNETVHNFVRRIAEKHDLTNARPFYNLGGSREFIQPTDNNLTLEYYVLWNIPLPVLVSKTNKSSNKFT